MIYLAVPYSGCEEYSYKFVTMYAAALVEEGHFVFSPITMCHPMAAVAKLPTQFEYWEAFDEKVIAMCDRLVVLKLAGWNRSTGVLAEIKIAERLKIPISFREIHELPSGLELSR